jgi:hypothetical protein
MVHQGILGTSAIHLQEEKAYVRIREQWFAMMEFEKSYLLSDIYLVCAGLQYIFKLKAATTLLNRLQK